MPNQSYLPNDIDLKHVALHNFSGDFIDVKEIMLEFNMYSDMFGEGMSCDVVLIDGDALIEKFPIVGNERIEIRFNIPGKEDIPDIRMIFEIYKISQRKRIDSRLDSYILHGVSGEQLNNVINSVTKTYYDIPISRMVSSIYDQYLKVSNVSKEITIKDTDRDFYFVGAGYRPMQAIRYLSKEAASSEKSQSSYIFFENVRGWHFVRIEQLMKQDPIDSFYHAVQNVDQNTLRPVDRDTGVFSDDPIAAAGGLVVNEEQSNLVGEQIYSYQKIAQFEFVNNFDLFNSAESGLYNNSVKFVDMLRKIVRTDDFFYDSDYQALPHLGRGSYNPDGSVFSKNNGSHYTNYIATEWDDEKKYSQLTYIKRGRETDRRIRNDRRLHTFAKYYTPIFAGLNNIVVNITIPGNPSVATGDTINIFLEQSSLSEDDRQRYNSLFSDGSLASKFLITSTRHIYNKNERNYSTIMRCIKDTYGKDPISEMT